jgi:hypothetical protein
LQLLLQLLLLQCCGVVAVAVSVPRSALILPLFLLQDLQALFPFLKRYRKLKKNQC